MKVIGAGWGRTGATLLAAALDRLGMGLCLQMQEMWSHPELVEVWNRRARGGPVDWRSVLSDWQSTVDWPGCSEWREFARLWPQAPYGWRPLNTASPDVIRPLSASGCNQEVCISISGSSNHVDEWNTTATWGGGFICTHSFWWINNQLIRTGNGACGGAGVFFSDWAANRFFPSPSLACNTWQSIPGEPCETIHT